MAPRELIPRRPWIELRPLTGERMPRPGNEVYKEEDLDRVEMCPWCRIPLLKVQKYFDYDRGMWVKFRQCPRCMARHEQLPQRGNWRR